MEAVQIRTEPHTVNLIVDFTSHLHNTPSLSVSPDPTSTYLLISMHAPP